MTFSGKLLGWWRSALVLRSCPHSLGDPVGNMTRHCPKFSCSLHMKHLVIKENVGPDLLQHGAFGGPGQEESLVDLQTPRPQRLQRSGTRTGCAASRHQVGTDRAVHALTFAVELLLQLPQSLQEAFQRTLKTSGEHRTVESPFLRIDRTILLITSQSSHDLVESLVHTEKVVTYQRGGKSYFLLKCCPLVARCVVAFVYIHKQSL